MIKPKGKLKTSVQDTTVSSTVVAEHPAAAGGKPLQPVQPIVVPEVSALSAMAAGSLPLKCDACGKPIQTGSVTVYPSHVYCSACAALGVHMKTEVPLPRPPTKWLAVEDGGVAGDGGTPAPAAPMKVDAAERKLWLEVYSGEYLRQIPLCGKHEKAALRASDCADAAIVGLRAHDEREVLAQEARKVLEDLPASKRGRLIGPAELIGLPLPFGVGAQHLADLDYVDEVALAINTQMAGYEKQFQELKQEFEKRLEAVEAESRTSRVERATQSVESTLRSKRKR